MLIVIIIKWSIINKHSKMYTKLITTNPQVNNSVVQTGVLVNMSLLLK